MTDPAAGASAGWSVLNLGDAKAYTNPKSGTILALESEDLPWREVGLNVRVLEPGQPACAYHGENAQEDFLVLHGECVLVVEDEERRLRRWDLVHCEPWTRHVFVGAGSGPCAILMIGARKDPEEFVYPVSEAAARYEASVGEETSDPGEAYAEWPRGSGPRAARWPL